MIKTTKSISANECVNLIIWGVGQGYAQNKYLINNMKYRLVDTLKEKWGSVIDGIEVENPDILYGSQYDYIAISTSLYFEEIFHRLTYQYSVPSEKIILLVDIEKELLFRRIGKYKLQKCNGPKILFGYCFLVYENCRVHDYLLAESLRLRGADITAVICGGIQEVECSAFGGVWGNDAHNIEEKKAKHKHNCLRCKRYEQKTWGHWGNFEVLSAIDFLTEDEKDFAKAFIRRQDINLVSNWTYKYFPIGEWALRRYFNHQLISYKNSWNQIEEDEIRGIVYNEMIMCIASLKIVDKVNPDIIYSNDSFYFPYSILEAIAKDRNIPFYNAYGFRKNTYSYAMNTSTVSMDLDSAWKTFSKRALNNEECGFIIEYIKNRKYGKDMMINTADPLKSAKEVKWNSIYGTINNSKKTALLATNVTWDAAALNKGIVFGNIVDWVLYTIDLFSKNTEWQLIVKAHPAEVNKSVPEAHERICLIVLKKYNNQLPSNIILIDGDAPVSVYELLNQIDLGMVYTTTVGLEMCCNGIPTITIANAPYRNKGFTYDPVTISEYEEQLNLLMNTKLSNEELERMVHQAQKFFLLYYFIYMLPNPFYTFSYEEGASLTIRDAEELLPGRNELWDYICDSILAKKAILSEKRFPPYKLEV